MRLLIRFIFCAREWPQASPSWYARRAALDLAMFFRAHHLFRLARPADARVRCMVRACVCAALGG